MNTLYTPDLSTPVSRPLYMTAYGRQIRYTVKQYTGIPVSIGMGRNRSWETAFNHRSLAYTTDWHQLLTVRS